MTRINSAIPDKEVANIMDEDLKTILTDITNLRKKISDYVINTEHWIYYWISSDEILNLIEEYPENYEEKVSISLMSIQNDSCLFRIKIDTDSLSYIDRYCIISTFRNTVKARYLQFNDEIKKKKLDELYENLEYYERIVKETKEKINKLMYEKTV